ncbi:ribosomal protection-like ABC-F family protein [Pseudobacteriovorax antillogorgiicola]|uniref:ATP-binding cassette, subfamily F, member 3 n=1 Tax=Pseudobacteriovorax antillogorgiicola TaxID=1513793 RepID=A0A1Y6CBE3_9BACT|nr:ABC-F family ATP-binding cassette domain-containing protein [Pseudobacteriovorax antillogorgiicola]TCS48620.1 ATP-binding cassette subfamily F protein 3 [Pseudobacteriovorax antillogorgiicola]SMF55443.1 ATP-binding cassette, subfamily F, member 3 [Pseudobacteriovorax antillogorgiicola]
MIQLDQLSKSFASKTVLDAVSFQFPSQKRIALIGANGAGKTTLLNILCGLEEPDSGKVISPGQFQIGYLPQEPNPRPESTIIEEAKAGAKTVMSIQKDLQASISRLEQDHSEDALKHHEALEAEFQRLDGYSLEAKAKSILAGLGFAEEKLTSHPTALSGGWRMRLELAKIFINEPDFLILDEPTNHLDLPSLVWVENYLKSFKGTLLFVSHDRSLLDRLANHTLLLFQGQLESYPSSFEKALEMRAERLELEEARRDNLAKKREKMEKFVERFGAKATKAKQAQSRVKMIGKLRELEGELNLEDNQQDIIFHLAPPQKSGRQVLEVNDLAIGYDAPLIEKLNLGIERGQKIAVIGANGIGKSTLLKSIVGELKPLAGEVDFGHNVEPAYFSQNHEDSLDITKDCLTNVLDGSTAIGEKDARSILGAFLFRGDDVFKEVEVLSGGEKSRVALAKILVQNANFLLLDEPTNHLDMSSVEALIQAVNQFEGTILFVSHDRTFIDAVCSHVFVMLPSGQSMLFEGKLDDYQLMAKQMGFPNVLDPDYSQTQETSPQATEQAVETPVVSQQEVKDLKRQRNSQQKKLEKLESEEAGLKAKRAELEEQSYKVDPKDYEQLAQIRSELDQIEERLEACETEWLEASEECERLEEQLRAINRL